jgi:hypothetical protein
MDVMNDDGALVEDESLQQQIDALTTRLSAQADDIGALQVRADKANRRAARNEHLAYSESRRMDRAEARLDVDEELIAVLTAEGVLSKQHAANLEEALRSARIIGAAIGIVMENRDVSEAEAFMSLSKASQASNRKLRVIANEVVNTRHLSLVPEGL